MDVIVLEHVPAVREGFRVAGVNRDPGPVDEGNVAAGHAVVLAAVDLDPVHPRVSDDAADQMNGLTSVDFQGGSAAVLEDDPVEIHKRDLIEPQKIGSECYGFCIAYLAFPGPVVQFP